MADKKTAHPIWGLRPADQIAEGARPDADFVLVRQHEEPYVDILEAQARMANRQRAWERLADAHAQRRVAEEGGEVPGSNDDGASMGFNIKPREASPDDEDCGPGEVEAAPGENEAAPRIPLEMMDTRKEESRYHQEQDDQRRREERNKQRRLQNRPGAEPSIPDAHKPLFDPAHQHEGAGGVPGAKSARRASLLGRRVRAYHDGGICEGVVMVEFPEGLVDMLLDTMAPGGADEDDGPQRITVGLDDIITDGESDEDEGESASEDSEREASRHTAQNVAGEIREGAARAIFHDAWSAAHGFVPINQLPATPPEAYAKADEIIGSVEQANGQSIEALYEESMGYNDEDAEHFGSPSEFGRSIGMGAIQPGTFSDYGRMDINIPPTSFTLTAQVEDGPGEDVTGQIREGIARAIFVLAWADSEESEGRGGMGWAGQDLMNLAPDTSPEALAKADQIIQQIQQANGKTVTDLFHEAMTADGYGEGDYDYFEANRFGHALGMMALGTGVSWFDDHERFPLKVPHNEFYIEPRALDQGEFETAMQTQMPTVEADASVDAEDYTEPGADSEFAVDAAALQRGTRHVALLSKVALGDRVYTEGALFRVEALSDETLSLISEAHRIQHEVSARAYAELTDHGYAEEVYL